MTTAAAIAQRARRLLADPIPPALFRRIGAAGLYEATFSWTFAGGVRNGFTMRSPSTTRSSCMSSVSKTLHPDCFAARSTRASQNERP